jgi:hypothetical protein
MRNLKSDFLAITMARFFYYDWPWMDFGSVWQRITSTIPWSALCLPRFFLINTDMQFAKDGSHVEYGTYWELKWWCGLYRIVSLLKGNRVSSKNFADNNIGAAPLVVNSSHQKTLDSDTDDAISFEWDFGTGAAKSGSKPVIYFESRYLSSQIKG